MKTCASEEDLEEVQLGDEKLATKTEEKESSAGFGITPFVYFRDFFFSKKFRSNTLLHNKTAIITGGNTGLGKETALDLASRGAKVILACRNTEKADKVAEEIKEKVPTANVVLRHLNLASFASIRNFAEETLSKEPQIHILINNAGVAACKKSTTDDGIEMQLGVNHVGHFLLTTLLLDRIRASAPARIVNVSSIAHHIGKIDFDDLNLDRRYGPLTAYNRSKLANLLFTRELARRLRGSGVSVYSLHPGAVNTELGRHIGTSFNRFTGFIFGAVSKVVFKSPLKGSQTTIYCAVAEELANESGYYYCNCTRIRPSKRARDDTLAEKLWCVSEGLVANA